ncbi:endonuclease/exonuclease/phosphatase family protein [Brevundimonas sp. SL130]|uniref:endonuclease/exonuclease/phosphatase family protein n=1 Tax=Brevundimonas sp. SL130 TaxID=2995143 RepID=UPI00226C67BD|nr:endonuclease/exonuclease/phosphatase family protein [Brevundimonas sp. SL130]WAC60861.1 endonuclease/exonuclease/phosphatase family protein [Brevundimonas sp. SL130]
MSLLKLAANSAACLVLIGLSFFGVAALSGIDHRWVDILAQFTGPVLLAAAGLTLACAVLRLWPAVGVGGLATLVLFVAVWPQWMTPMGLRQPDQPVIRVYSANLWTLNTDVDAMRASIKEADADIVILVEVGDAPIAQLDRLLADYPHRRVNGVMTLGQSASRSVIASRYPIVKKLPWRRDGLSAIGAVVETPLGPLTVFGVHLTRPWPYEYQWGQISQVMALTERRKAATPGATLVAGDFNSVSSARIGRQIKKDLGLVPAPGFPGTWPTRLPAVLGITIDQVYRSPDLALVSRRIGRPTGSDHYPVVTELTRAKP